MGWEVVSHAAAPYGPAAFTAALIAPGGVGGWQGKSKEASATVQKLANAPALPNEPPNHRYVREVAKETLPPSQAGRSAL